MSTILYPWCLFLLQISFMFAVISNGLSMAESTSTLEASSSTTSSSAVSPSLSMPTTVTTATVTIGETTETTTTLATTAPTTTSPIPIPDPPTNVIVSSINPIGFDVSWTKSPNATEYYAVSVNNTLHVNTNESKCTLRDNLIGGSFYVIRVKACVHTNCSNATEGSNTTYPSKPGQLLLTNQSSSSFAINWKQSGSFSLFIVTVDYKNHHNLTKNATIERSSSGNDTIVHCNIGGLQVPGGNYTVSISAVIGNLQSDFQESSFLTEPAQPQNVALLHRTVDMLWITWDQFGDFEYISWSVNDTNTTRGVIPFQPNNESCYSPCGSLKMYLNITNLPTAGEMYSIELIASVANITSRPLTVSNSTAPYGPVNFLSRTGTSDSIHLSWNRPSGRLESYKLFYSSGSTEETKTIPAENVTHVLTHLSSDSNYTITLQTLSFGQSSDNATGFSWTLPDKVLNATCNPQETTVDVSWSPPKQHNNICLYSLKIVDTTVFSQLVNLQCKASSTNQCSGTNSSFVNETDFNCNGSLKYTFMDLQRSTDYNITISAVNPGGKSLPEEKSVTTIYIQPNSGWIAGVVIGCVLVILLIIAIILFLRWRQDKPLFKGKNHSTSVNYKGGEENLTYEEYVNEPEPVAVDAFVDYAKKMALDSNYLYACEYALLTKLSPKNENVAAELPDNRSKNRYTDILPYDNSRVKLVVPEEDMGEGDFSDYVNASFMPGFNSQREYIAAQGPMTSTLDSFWLMIWQQNVSMVVMVTNLTERGREKCEQYWPEDNAPTCYGNIYVLLKTELLHDFYIIRVLEVSYGSEKRKIFQYHFLAWPDFGVPEDMEHILTFVKDIRKSIQGSDPLLVHCSAGVGRTGTFIVVDHLLQLIKKERWIDLFHLVLDLRQHRPKMIQAESQYVFAHECIRMAIEKGLHRESSLNIVEDEQANGDCLYVNASETATDTQLYANASEFHEQSV